MRYSYSVTIKFASFPATKNISCIVLEKKKREHNREKKEEQRRANKSKEGTQHAYMRPGVGGMWARTCYIYDNSSSEQASGCLSFNMQC
jgi:hypothetical protein